MRGAAPHMKRSVSRRNLFRRIFAALATARRVLHLVVGGERLRRLVAHGFLLALLADVRAFRLLGVVKLDIAGTCACLRVEEMEILVVRRLLIT